MLLYINLPVKNFQKKEVKLSANKHESLAISDKAFSVKGLGANALFSDFSKKIELGLYDPRPDESRKQKFIEVKLQSDKETRVISSGEKIYLYYDRGYKFSKVPTEFWLMFSSINSNNVNVVVRACYKDVEGNDLSKEESFELVASTQGLNLLSDSEEEEVLALKNAIYLGPDLFLDMCDKDNGHSHLHRLMFLSNDMCHVKKGDHLIFKEGKWQVAGRGIDTKSYSLARVNSINDKGLEIDCWKVGKVKKYKIILNKANHGTTLRVGEDFITELNVRTKRQISCKIQGQRVIINEKDLLYKKEGIWKKGSILDFENQKDATEFFIFEKLDAVSPVKSILGYVFNNDKTQVVKVEKNIIKKIAGKQSAAKPPVNNQPVNKPQASNQKKTSTNKKR